MLPATAIDTLLLLLVHTPPADVSLSDTIAPWHMELAPCTGLGKTFTVNTVVVTQLPDEYEIVTVPLLTELDITVPIAGFGTTAIVPLLLVHEPPGVLLVNNAVSLWQPVQFPKRMGDDAPMFTVVVLRHPEASL